MIIASTFYETLAMMAAGSVLALVALLAAGNAQPAMLALAGGLTAGLLLAVLPPVFGRLTTWTARSFQKAGSIPIATDHLCDLVPSISLLHSRMDSGRTESVGNCG